MEALKEQQLEFLDWLVNDDPAKGSQNQWCHDRGISTSTVSRWKRNPVFKEAWGKRLAEENISPEKVQKALDKLYEKATEDGNVQALMLWLQHVEKLQPPRPPIVGDDRVRTLSDDELLAEIEDAMAELRTTGGTDGFTE